MGPISRANRILVLCSAFALSLACSSAIPASEAPDASPLPGWNDYMSQITAAGEAVLKTVPHSDDPRSRQETWRAMFGAIGGNFLQYVYSDPRYPEFVPVWNSAFNLLAPNADTVYAWTNIEGSGVYRIRGLRNTVRFAELYFQKGNMIDGQNTYATLDLDALKLNADSGFDVLLSTDRPKGYVGDWFELSPDYTSILLRSVAYDWIHERDVVLSIDRLDVPAARPRPTAGETAHKLSMLPRFIQATQVWGNTQFRGSEGARGRQQVHDSRLCPSGRGVYTELSGGFVRYRRRRSAHCRGSTSCEVPLLEFPGHRRPVRYGGLGESSVEPQWISGAPRQRREVARRHIRSGSRRAQLARYRRVSLRSHSGTMEQVRFKANPDRPQGETGEAARKIPPPHTPIVTPAARDASLRERRMGAQFRRKW